jgi:hypothetical protein
MLIWVNVDNSAPPHTEDMTAMLAHPPHVTIEGWSLRPLERGEAALAYPLLLALEQAPEPLPVWQARVRDWLAKRRDRKQRRGIMTLRSPAGVIAGFFFFALTGEGLAPAVLLVPLLRVIEPLGGWRGLGAALQAIEALARELGCGGVLVQAEPASGTWAQLAIGLDAVGRAKGYIRRGEDWYRPIENEAGVVRLPGRRI